MGQYVTHSRATVVYNTCHHLFRKRLCTTLHQLACATWMRQQYQVSHLRNAQTTVVNHLSTVCGSRSKHVKWFNRQKMAHMNHPFQNLKKKAKMSNELHNIKCSSWISLSKTVNLLKTDSTIIEKSWPGQDGKNDDVYAIWCRLELAEDDISGEDGEAFHDYVYVSLWVASFSSFRENSKKALCNA